MSLEAVSNLRGLQFERSVNKRVMQRVAACTTLLMASCVELALFIPGETMFARYTRQLGKLVHLSLVWVAEANSPCDLNHKSPCNSACKMGMLCQAGSTKVKDMKAFDPL